MARGSEVNVFEKHVEKMVLGVCAIVFAYALVHWGLSNPSLVMATGISGSEASVTPDQADAALASAAIRVDEDAQRKPVHPEPTVPYSRSFQNYQNNPVGTAAKPMANLADARPALRFTSGVERTVTLPELAELVKALPRPEKPMVKPDAQGRQIAVRELVLKGDKSQDVITAHVTSVYPWSDAFAAISAKLQDTAIPSSLNVLRVEAQVELVQADGAGAGEIKPVKPVVLMVRDNKLVEVDILQSLPQIPQYTGQNGPQVQQAVKALEAWRALLLEPEYWQIFWPVRQWGTWRIHLAKTVISTFGPADPANAAQPWGAPNPAMIEGYPTSPVPGGPASYPPTVMPPTNEPPIPPGVAPPVRRTPPATPMPTAPPPGTPPLPAGGGPGPGRMGPTGPIPPGATPVNTPRPATPRPTPTVAPAVVQPRVVALPEITPIPSLDVQIQKGKVQFWLHDNDLESLKVYRYRVRLVLVNPLLAYESEIKTKDDAKVIELATPWSDWSEPILAPRTTEFYLTGASANTNAVGITVFTHLQGQAVKESFMIQPGQAIGKKATVDVTNPMTGKHSQEQVDLTTGCVAVEFDFNRRYVRGNISQPTVEMLYLDENGQLKSRIRAADEDDPQYLQRLDEAKQSGSAAAGGVIPKP